MGVLMLVLGLGLGLGLWLGLWLWLGFGLWLGLGLLFHIYILGFVFGVNPWISTHGSNVTLCSLNAYRDGKNMCVCSSWGQRRLFERQ